MERRHGLMHLLPDFAALEWPVLVPLLTGLAAQQDYWNNAQQSMRVGYLNL